MNIQKTVALCLTLLLSHANIISNYYEEINNLFKAVRTNDTALGQQALEFGIDPNLKTFDGFSILHIAIFNKSYDVAKLLIDAGADIDSKIYYLYEGDDALHIAIKLHDIKMIDTIINSHPKYSYIDVIHIAIWYHFNDLAKEFMYMNNDMHAFGSDYYDHNSTLHTAVLACNFDMVRWLIDHGVSVNIINEWEETPLHLAVTDKQSNNYNSLDIIELLLDYDADTKAENYCGETALDIAKDENNNAAIELLTEFQYPWISRADDIFNRLHAKINNNFNKKQ